MASTSQIIKIHTLKNILGIDNDLYLELLKPFNAVSSKTLTYKQANELLERLETDAEALGKWKRLPKKYDDLIRCEEMATPAQLRMIKGLWKDLTNIQNDKIANSTLRKILNSKLKSSDLMFLTKEQANKAINIIKAIKKNSKSAATLS
jgi:hypothetical protein